MSLKDYDSEVKSECRSLIDNVIVWLTYRNGVK